MKEYFDLSSLRLYLDRAKSRVNRNQPKVLVSFSFPWHNGEPVELFVANYEHEQPVTFWNTPENGCYSVSFGSVYEFSDAREESYALIQHAWQELLVSSVIVGEHQPTLFGGFSFDRQKPSTLLWQDFPPTALTLPQFVFHRDRDQSYLVINCLVDAQTNCDLVANNMEQHGTTVAKDFIPPPRSVC